MFLSPALLFIVKKLRLNEVRGQLAKEEDSGLLTAHLLSFCSTPSDSPEDRGGGSGWAEGKGGSLSPSPLSSGPKLQLLPYLLQPTGPFMCLHQALLRVGMAGESEWLVTSSSPPQKDGTGIGGGALLTSAALPPCSPSLGSASVINLLPQMADLEEDQKGTPQSLLGKFSRSLALVSSPPTWSREWERERPLALLAFF